jgi:hypothetical protein
MFATIQFRIFCFPDNCLTCKDENKQNYILILPVVSYGCETWCLTLMEEHGLSVLKRIFRLEMKLTEHWKRKFHMRSQI